MNHKEEEGPRKGREGMPFTWCLNCGSDYHIDEDCAIKGPRFFKELFGLEYNEDEDCAKPIQLTHAEDYYPKTREGFDEQPDAGSFMPHLVKGRPFMWCLNCWEHDHDEKDCTEGETGYWDEIFHAARTKPSPFVWKIAKTKPNGELYYPDDDED